MRVVDEGIGIPAADQPRIFSKFVRGEPGPGASTHGTGVGLFLSRGLLAAMNGRIWVESEEGQGLELRLRAACLRPGAERVSIAP